MTNRISHSQIFEEWISNPKISRTSEVLKYVFTTLGNPELPGDSENRIKAIVTAKIQQVKQKWNKSQRHRERFVERNAEWLKQNIDVLEIILAAKSSDVKPGRPKKDFQNCTSKVQTRKITELVATTSAEKLYKATVVQLRKEGKRDSAAIVNELTFSSPKRGTQIKKSRITEDPPKLSGDQALALMIDGNLSTHQYNVIRDQAKNVNCNLYPPYYVVRESKKACYPTSITVTETSAEIPVQSLIDHTVSRLCKAQEEVIQSLHLSDTIVPPLHVILKWGCDGAEQSTYRQRFSEEYCSDASLFSNSMVPVQMYVFNKDDTKKIIWQNPAIKFIFEKETSDLIKTEVEKIKQQISALNTTSVQAKNQEITVKSSMILCMIDGKICNAVSSCTSTQTCYLCGAKPKEMNNIIVMNKVVDVNHIPLGLSPLHSWIRFFECILHISYRLEFKSWQARGTENKEKLAHKKKLVQDQFREQLGLLVDIPKQQTGNTNDGNTARKFFRNAEVSAKITGVNVELIKQFGVILECLNNGFAIHALKFGEYTRETVELYLKDYSWYPMPVSVYKVLVHGRDIVNAMILPIGQMSEEAQEARNKDNRKYREVIPLLAQSR